MVEILASSRQFNSLLENLAGQILKDKPQLDKLVLMGIHRRGADIATRLAALLKARTGKEIPCGSIDVNLYRDDWTRLASRAPVIGKTSVPATLDDRHIIVVDDVLFSGRTIRAAMEALLDYGRPETIRLLVLIDRGHRELPICANYVGLTLPTERGWHVDVLTREHDGEDAINLERCPKKD